MRLKRQEARGRQRRWAQGCQSRDFSMRATGRNGLKCRAAHLQFSMQQWQMCLQAALPGARPAPLRPGNRLASDMLWVFQWRPSGCEPQCGLSPGGCFPGLGPCHPDPAAKHQLLSRCYPVNLTQATSTAVGRALLSRQNSFLFSRINIGVSGSGCLAGQNDQCSQRAAGNSSTFLARSFPSGGLWAFHDPRDPILEL